MNFKLICIIEAILIAVIIIFLLINRFLRQKKMKSYIESVTYSMDSAKNYTLMNFPLPIAVYRIDDTKIVWGNEYFFNICGSVGSRLDAKLSDLIPSFSSKWLLEGKTQYSSLLELNGRKYRIHGNLVKTNQEDDTVAFLAITYWIDVTEYDDIRIEYENTRPEIAIIAIDNLEELTRNQPDKVKNDIRESVEDKLTEWAQKYNGVIRRYDRDKYIGFFEKQHLDKMKEDKFSITETMHEIESPNGISTSVSIGFSEDGVSIPESLQYADTAVDLALTRGGDQTVIKNKLNYEFFGGRGLEVEKRTKVKSRVMANTLGELIQESSKVIVMGHKFGDYDSYGAAVGISCLCRKYDVSCYIVLEKELAARPLINMLKSKDEYKGVFLSPHDAMIYADGHTLLVIVDTNRPEQVVDSDLLEACNRVAIIDHHRVSATYVQNAALGFIEPYASSTCELVSEILDTLLEKDNILDYEANAVLSGIVLDTKNFTIRTGERTFDAASFLKRNGADTIEVKKLLQFDLDDTISKYKILQTAEIYRHVAIAVPIEPQTRVVAAAAADDLLNVDGVEAAIVIASGVDGSVFASARSIGDLNVQIIMEKLGGGGNRSAAAVQFTDLSISEAVEKVYVAIDDYLGD